MEQLIINLTPKTEEFNPNFGNGRKILRNVYFRVEVPFYTFTFGHSKPEEAKKGEENTRKFFVEVVSLLQSDGWTLENEDYKREHSGNCPQLMKGLQSLYCHPQSISGNLYPDTIPTLEALFATAQTFKHYHTDNYRNIIVCTSTEDEQKLYHEKLDGTIKAIIKEYTTTKRCNLYKDINQVIYRIAEKIRIDTLFEGDFFKNYRGQPHWQYVSEHIDRLTAEGWIKTATSIGEHKIIRWANKAEEKALLKKTA